MPYDLNLPKAARRHLEAAEELRRNQSGKRIDVAGYLYGIAAECAVKAMIIEIPGALQIEKENKTADQAHFPALRSMLAERLQGRKAQTLLAFVRDPQFMEHWSIKMRYSSGHEITSDRVEKWAEQARRLISAMDA